MDNLTTTSNKGEITALCADAISELERAVRSKPEFPGDFSMYEKAGAKELLKAFREMNDGGKARATTVFEEEYYEFLEMALAGNRKWARIELVQAMAMLLRIYCHFDSYVSETNKAITQSGNNAILQEVQP